MKTISKNPYAVLDVDVTATSDEIKAAYKKLAMANHPDRGGKAERMAEINWAYELLSDPAKREHYDRFGYEERPDNISPLEQDLLKIWSDLIAGAGFEPSMDFFAAIREEINNRIQKTQQEAAAMEKRLPKFKKLRERVKKKGEKSTIFHLHLDKTIAVAEDHIKKLKAQLELCAQQLEYLEGFEFEADQAQTKDYQQLASIMFGSGQNFGSRRNGW